MEAHIRSIVAFCKNMMPFTPLRLKTAGLRLWSHYDNVQNGGNTMILMIIRLTRSTVSLSLYLARSA